MVCATHGSDNIPCAGMACMQGASMGGFGGPMWVYNTQEVWCSNSKICGSDTPNILTIYLIWSTHSAYTHTGHAQGHTQGHMGLGIRWGTLLGGLGKVIALNFEKFKSFEIFKICMGKTVRFPCACTNTRTGAHTASCTCRWGGNMSSMCPLHAVKV